MARACTICGHPHRYDMERMVCSGISVPKAAAKYGVTRDSLRRHVINGHVSKHIQKARDKLETEHVRTMLEKLSDLEDMALDTIQKARSKKDLKSTCSAIREYRSTLELSGKITGEYRPGVDITGKDGGPIRIAKSEDLSDDELADIATRSSS
jgi:hypothetical protein